MSRLAELIEQTAEEQLEWFLSAMELRSRMYGTIGGKIPNVPATTPVEGKVYCMAFAAATAQASNEAKAVAWQNEVEWAIDFLLDPREPPPNYTAEEPEVMPVRWPRMGHGPDKFSRNDDGLYVRKTSMARRTVPWDNLLVTPMSEGQRNEVEEWKKTWVEYRKRYEAMDLQERQREFREMLDRGAKLRHDPNADDPRDDPATRKLKRRARQHEARSKAIKRGKMRAKKRQVHVQVLTKALELTTGSAAWLRAALRRMEETSSTEEMPGVVSTIAGVYRQMAEEALKDPNLPVLYRKECTEMLNSPDKLAAFIRADLEAWLDH